MLTDARAKKRKRRMGSKRKKKESLKGKSIPRDKKGEEGGGERCLGGV